MNKIEFMEKFGITMRKVTKEDMEKASTTYQRNSEYIITYSNGVEFYSTKGTMKDIQNGLKLIIDRMENEKC